MHGLAYFRDMVPPSVEPLLPGGQIFEDGKSQHSFIDSGLS